MHRGRNRKGLFRGGRGVKSSELHRTGTESPGTLFSEEVLGPSWVCVCRR